MKAFVQLNKLTCRYKDNGFTLRNLSLDGEAGDLIVIKGANGSGKSTILRLISGLGVGELEYEKSKINVSSQPVIIYPDPKDQLLTFSVQEELASRLSYKKVLRHKRVSVVHELLHRFNFNSFAKRDPRKLSSGEQQITISLAQMIDNSSIILIDEPLRYLDKENIDLFVKFLEEIRVQGKLIFVASHTDIFDEIATKVVSLGDTKAKKAITSYHGIEGEELYSVNATIGYDKPLRTTSFNFPRTGIRVIFGRNGSGKTLLLKSLAKMVKIVSGTLEFPKNIGFLSDKPEYMFSHPTVAEELNGIECPDWLIPFQTLSPFNLSTGYKKLLAIYILINNYESLLLDEPFQSLDQYYTGKVWDLLLHNSKSKLIVLTTNRYPGNLSAIFPPEIILEM